MRHRAFRFDVELGDPHEEYGVRVARRHVGGRHPGRRPVSRLQTQPETPGVVSVVIVNYRGADDTFAALAALRELDWPRERLESSSSTTRRATAASSASRRSIPEVEVLALDAEPRVRRRVQRRRAGRDRRVPRLPQQRRPARSRMAVGRGRRCSTGTARSRASPARCSTGTASWSTSSTPASAFYGHGFKLHAGEPDTPAYDREADVLFASGAAMVARASTFREVGGFDERYFMFFEDVDLGWRLWLLGYRVRYVPASLAFHRHHASMGALGAGPGALPARAQRAVHDLQELRRRQPAAVAPGGVDARRSAGDRPRRRRHRRARSRSAARPHRTRTTGSTSTPRTARAVVRRRLVRRGAPRAHRRPARAPGGAPARRPRDHSVCSGSRCSRTSAIPSSWRRSRPSSTPWASTGSSRSAGGSSSLTGDVLEPRMAGPGDPRVAHRVRARTRARRPAREHRATCSLTHPDFPVRARRRTRARRRSRPGAT